MNGLRTAGRLIARERRTRLFFTALTQSSLGTGAGYVALLVLAYERYRSAWAITAILLADLVPSMFFGPMLGAAADRWSRRSCLVAADVVRAGAFMAIAVVSGIEATIVLAFVAGMGNALFKPAALAALPSLTSKDARPAATSVFGAIADLGFTVGPALAALGLLLGSAEDLLFVNGITFAVSALLLWRIQFGPRVADDIHAPADAKRSLWHETSDGIKAVARMRGVRVVIAASAGALLCGGFFNVAELLFVTEDLGSDSAGYSILVALFGAGFVIGSLSGADGGSVRRLKRRYVAGVAVMGIGFVACGLSPSLPVALAAFTLAGLGNGMLLVHERLLIQETISETLQGRVFAISDTLVNWGFGVAFISAGAVLSAIGAREVILAGGAIGLIVALVVAVALRSQWPGADEADAPALGRGAHALR